MSSSRSMELPTLPSYPRDMSSPSKEACIRVRVYFDGWCETCRKTVRTLARLDINHSCEFVSFREGVNDFIGGPAPSDFQARMQVFDSASGSWLGGRAGLELIARRMILLWPLYPGLVLSSWLGLGDRAYDWFARRRLIVTDPARCLGECRREASDHRPADTPGP